MQLCRWLLVIRELQNGWEIGNGLWKSSCPSSGPSRATYIKFLRTISRWVSSISNGEDSTLSLDKLCQCLVTLIAKKCSLMFRGNILCFSSCPLSLVLSLNTPEEYLAPSSFHPSYRYLYTMVRSPLQTFSILCWTVPALPVFPQYVWFSSPFIILVDFTGLSPTCPCLSSIGEPETGPRTPDVVSPVLRRGEGSPPSTC